MNEILQQFLPQLTHGEKIELLSALKTAIAEELAGERTDDPERCPLCGCPRFVKKGFSVDNAQRWLCRGCGSTFSGKTGGLLSRSKLDANTWMTFAECMADALSLRESANRCGVSLYTSWFMRMRVCEVMGHLLSPARKGVFHLDGTLIRDNLSGNLENSFLELPRKRHRNGQDGRKNGKGRSKEQIVVECGINEYGDCFCDAIDRGSAGAGELAMDLSKRIPRGSVVVTDGHPSYGFAARQWSHEVVDPNDPSTGNINMVNALHSRLKEFLMPFHGVATRRLQRYLDWFCYTEQFKRGDMDRRELLYIHEAAGTYWKTRRDTHFELDNLMVYWTRQYSKNVNSGLT